METAQHAGQILQAWKTADRPRLVTALDSASQTCNTIRSLSRLEFEQQEILESVVQHLLHLNCNDQVPQYASGNGALVLLSHLSSDPELRECPMKKTSSQKRN